MDWTLTIDDECTVEELIASDSSRYDIIYKVVGKQDLRAYQDAVYSRNNQYRFHQFTQNFATHGYGQL